MHQATVLVAVFTEKNLQSFCSVLLDWEGVASMLGLVFYISMVTGFRWCHKLGKLFAQARRPAL